MFGSQLRDDDWITDLHPIGECNELTGEHACRWRGDPTPDRGLVNEAQIVGCKILEADGNVGIRLELTDVLGLLASSNDP